MTYAEAKKFISDCSGKSISSEDQKKLIEAIKIVSGNWAKR